MKVDTKLIAWLLKTETQYKIHKETGVAQSTLSGLLNGKRKIENLTIAIGSKLTEYAAKLQKEVNEMKNILNQEDKYAAIKENENFYVVSGNARSAALLNSGGNVIGYIHDDEEPQDTNYVNWYLSNEPVTVLLVTDSKQEALDLIRTLEDEE
ncbi:hypothetical protein [Tuanshanicoccus yangjingiae]|uniref:hypothetical protein n=1 Tax=Aerococcaceae bacterium zg-252 TaxID=2796928 RepID=UPI00406340E9